MISFAYPEALLIGVLLVVLYFRFVRRNFWRTVIVVLACLLLAYPSFVVSSKQVDIFVLLDRSKSIPAEGIKRQADYLDLVNDNLEEQDRVAVVSFNERAYVEQAPSAAPAVKEFANPFSTDGSDLSDGLATALSMVSDSRQSRILLLSDGEYTGRDPLPQAQVARQRGVPVYVHDLKRQNVENLFVAEAETEEKLLAGEPFRIVFRVNSTVDMLGRYRVLRDGTAATDEGDQGWRPYNFRMGENRIAFTDAISAAGIHGYRIEVAATSATREMVTADNVGEKFVSVIGERPMLVVNSDGQPDNVTEVLTAGAIPTQVVGIGNYRFGINELSGYKGVILNNVPITGMQKTQIDDLRNFVTQEGGGLLVVGGNRSFAAGGYYRTSIDEILPVSLEDRRQSKKMSGAFAFVLDRSGSMAVTVPSGQTKMDLANAASIEALNLLSAADSISVTAVDSAAHPIVEQRPVENPADIAAQIRRIESMGGGIFVYVGLVAGGQQLVQAPQANKHILLFADAADAEEPEQYVQLLRDYKEAGITVSVVGLGTAFDVDADLLRDIAQRGGGNVYFTEDPHQLVQFFTADTIQYTWQNFIEDPAPMKVMPPAFSISAEQQWSDFSAADYNLLFPKDGADTAIVTANGDASPVLAFWQRGVGRSAALALDASSDFAETEDFPDIVLSTARWIMGSNVNDNLQVKAATQGNYARVTMEVSDEERAAMGQARLVMYAPDGSTVERPMQWDSWNRLSADLRLNQTGAWRGLVQVGGESYRVAPVNMPVSPEFAYREGVAPGREKLMELAAVSAGGELIDVGPLFERGDESRVRMPLVLPLLIAMLVALVGEVAEGRFGLVGRLSRWLRGRREAAERTQRTEETVGTRRTKSAGLTSRRKVRRPVVSDLGVVDKLEKVRKTESPTKGERREEPPAETMDYLGSVKSKARREMKKK